MSIKETEVIPMALPLRTYTPSPRLTQIPTPKKQISQAAIIGWGISAIVCLAGAMWYLTPLHHLAK